MLPSAICAGCEVSGRLGCRLSASLKIALSSEKIFLRSANDAREAFRAWSHRPATRCRIGARSRW
jgi:hypothetical protein